MRPILLLFSFLLWVTQTFSQSPLRADVGKDYVLFIYADSFSHPDWVPLPTVKKEVSDLKAELQSNYGFTLLPDLKNPTKAAIIQRLDEYAKPGRFNRGDQLLIFASSHGYANHDNSAGGLVLTDSKSYENDPSESTLLAYNKLRELVEKIPTSHTLLALDACFSGLFDQEFKGNPGGGKPWEKEPTCEERVREALRGTTRFYLTSVGQNDRSPSQSTFAIRFLDRLREQDNDGIISSYELYAKLVSSVKPTPHQGEFKSHEKGNDFVFIRNKVCDKDSAALKGSLPCLERPIFKPAKLGAPATSLHAISEAKSAELFAVVPRLEGGYAAFGYSKSVSGRHAPEPELSGGGGEDMVLLLADRKNATERLLTLGRKGDERALAGLQTFDGGYVLAGYSNSPGEDAMGQKDAYVVKLDAQGGYLWHCRNVCSSKKDDQFNKIIQLDDGTLVVAGVKDGQPLVATISSQGLMEVLPSPLTQSSSVTTLAEITALSHTPYNDVLLAGHTKGSRGTSPFLMRFSIEGRARVGDIYYFEGKYKEAKVIGLDWSSMGNIQVLCTVITRAKQEDGLLFRGKDIDGEISINPNPIQFGGNASDLAKGFCLDAFGNAYLSGGSKSYKSTGGLFDKMFLMEINAQGNATMMTEDPKIKEGSEFLGWQGGPNSWGNAVAMLPNHRLIVVGKDDEQASVLHFDLKVPPNEDPQLYFDEQALRFYDGQTPNNRLDVGETAWQMIRVESNCRYVTGAYIQVEVEDASKISCPRNLYLNDLPALAGQSVALPLTGLKNIRPGASTGIVLTLFVGTKRIGKPLHVKVRH